MRIIDSNSITNAVKQMCIETNYQLSEDMTSSIYKAEEKETSILGKQVLQQLVENMKIANKERIPICQDTGMVTVFIRIGQEVHIEGEFLEDAINRGIRLGYEEGYLRKSIVEDPIDRINTKDNTPGVIHYEIIKGDKIEIIVAPKGFGSENMSRVCMLKPSDGIDGIKHAVIETVKKAGPNACPPIVVGVGIGGNFEKCAYLAKKALTRDLKEHSKQEHIKQLELELLEDINSLNIGPAGFGGINTALGVNIESYPTHIAGMPIAINICCHVNRHMKQII